jgi:hypothetical protein
MQWQGHSGRRNCSIKVYATINPFVKVSTFWRLQQVSMNMTQSDITIHVTSTAQVHPRRTESMRHRGTVGCDKTTITPDHMKQVT